MDPYRMLYVLKKGRYLIVAVTLIAILTSAVTSLFIIPPTYEARVVLMVGKVYIGSYGSIMLRDDIHLANSLMKSYNRLLYSTSVAEKAIELGRLNASPEDLLNSISTNIPQDSQIIELAARADGPVTAANYANALAKAFTIRVEELMGVKNVTIVDEAVPPATPYKPNLKENILRAAFAGLITSLIIIFSLNLNDERKRDQ